MPAFELELMDGEGEHIEVPGGETVVGRGPFLGVNDKRVSRNHAILENVDGQLRLKPTHVNPCFIQTSLEEKPQPLEKDNWHCLKGGSIFSLLPGKYIYRVCFIADDRTPRNSQGFEDEEEMEIQTQDGQTTTSSHSYEETLEYTPQPTTTNSHTSKTTHVMDTPDPVTSNQVPSCSSKGDLPNPLTPQRKRVLPAWMMSVSPVVQSPSTTKATKRTTVQTSQKPSSSKRTAKPKRARNKYELSLSGGEDEEDEGEEVKCREVKQTPRKRARRLKSDTEDSQDQVPISKSNQLKSPEEEESVVMQSKDSNGAESQGAEGSSNSRSGDTASGLKRSGDSQTNEKSSLKQQSKIQSRTPCPYGSSCYRKNPIHFQECSHPGDNDYKEAHDDDDDNDVDDRPECPYGTDCYRKNPLHKKEYKHTKPPDDDEDEDHYEDSFINDESEEEEVDEDSDYVPDLEESDKEDIKRLQKEAKAFLKRKK